MPRSVADRFFKVLLIGSKSRGTAAPSMNDIVSAAQMTKGAVYFHFSSKDELAQAVIEEQHQISISAFTAVAATGAPGTGNSSSWCATRWAANSSPEPIVRAGIRLTLELASADGSQGPSTSRGSASFENWPRPRSSKATSATMWSRNRWGRVVISAFTGVQLVSNVLTRRSDLNDRIDELFTPPVGRRGLRQATQRRRRTGRMSPRNLCVLIRRTHPTPG